MRARSVCALLVMLAAMPCAGDVKPAPLPDTPASIQTLLTAPYLTDDEARDKRVFFGRWTKDDLNTPVRAARAALMRGAYDDPALESPEADPLDRADALLLRGRGEAAVAMVKGMTSLRAVRVRAAALEMLGRSEEAGAEAQRSLDGVLGKTVSTASDAVEAVRLAVQRIRLQGSLIKAKENAPGSLAAADFQALMQTLGDVRSKGDRMYWPALLAEAELLYAKDNKPKAQEAVIELLTMNPACAEGWALMGRLTVDGFQFEKAEQFAARLSVLAASDMGVDEPDDEARGVSTQGAAIMARAMLRQIDGAQAEEFLAPALARYPEQPRLLALRAAAAALRFDDAATKAALARFEELFPRSPDAEMEVGRALAEARQYDAAATHLAIAAERMPFAPEPLIERGLLELQAGRDDEAQTALERAFTLDPFNVRADNCLRLVREMRTYERIETPNYVIRYKKAPDGTAAPDEVLAIEMPEVLEANARVVTGVAPPGIEHTLPGGRKTQIDLMPDHEWFGVRIAGMPRIHTVAASTGPVIAMEAPREGPGHFGVYDWARVLRHEYVHTITLSRSKNRIPHWFTEASAVFLELAPRDYQTCQMLARALDTDTLFDFGYLNVAFVRPKKPSDRSMAYAQGEWMYAYMVETFGGQAPLKLMDEYAKGVREEEAFATVLGLSRAEYFARFKVWAREQARSWGLVSKEGVPSVRELRMLSSKIKIVNPGEEAEADEGESIDAAFIEKWLARYPQHPDLLEAAVDMAVSRTEGRATPESAELIEKYAAARPVDPKPHKLLARMYLDQAKNDPGSVAENAGRVVKHLEFLDQREQKTPAFAIELAKRYAAMGNTDLARQRALRATQLAPFAADVREAAALVAIQIKDLDMAERQLTALVRIEPTRELNARRLEAIRKMKADAK